MAYLTDYLELSFPTTQEQAALASLEYVEWRKLKRKCEIMLEREYFASDARNWSDPERLVIKKEERLVSTIWKKYQFVPHDMRKSVLGGDSPARALTDFCGYPQIKLGELREAANKLDLMILPLAYFDTAMSEKALKGLYYYNHSISLGWIQKMIAKIADYTEQELYVLCPVSLYGLSWAENDTCEREMFFGGELTRVKAFLESVRRIQKNLFAILRGDEGDTDIWEIGEGGECSENELRHLRILVKTIMPIQRSLLEIVRRFKDIEGWEETMREMHYEEVAQILQGISKQLPCSKEAEKALNALYAEGIKKTPDMSWVISEAGAMTNIMIFALPRETSMKYGDGLAKLIEYRGVEMPESFYHNMGFVKQQQDEEKIYRSWYETITLKLDKD